MSRLICPTCQNVFKIGALQAGMECPCVGCHGSNNGLIECDELMIPVVSILNGHGFTTHHSCSGHYGGHVTDFYLSFEVPSIDQLKIIAKAIQKFNSSELYNDEVKFDVDCYYTTENDDELYKTGFRLIRYSDDVPEKIMMNQIDSHINYMGYSKGLLKLYLAVDGEGITISKNRSFKYFDINPGLSDYLLMVNNALQEVIFNI